MGGKGHGWQAVSNQKRFPSRAPCPGFPSHFRVYSSDQESELSPNSRQRTEAAGELHRERGDGGVSC